MKIGELVEIVFIIDGKEGCLVVKDKIIIFVLGCFVMAIDIVGVGDVFVGGVLYVFIYGY